MVFFSPGPNNHTLTRYFLSRPIHQPDTPLGLKRTPTDHGPSWLHGPVYLFVQRGTTGGKGLVISSFHYNQALSDVGVMHRKTGNCTFDTAPVKGLACCNLARSGNERSQSLMASPSNSPLSLKIHWSVDTTPIRHIDTEYGVRHLSVPEVSQGWDCYFESGCVSPRL